jgi:O-antigen ligase
MNAYVKGPEALNKAIHINYLSWIVTGAVLLILLFIAQDVLFVESRWGLTGYHITGQMSTIAEMPMTRSSGLARFAAIPGIVAFVFLLTGKLRRLVWVVVFFFSVTLVYFMQSRGAILGLGFALSFVMLFFGRKTRVLGICIGILIGLLLFTNIIPEEFIKFQMERFMRGQDVDELYTLTGRTRAWNNGWYEAMKSPIIGWGPQADRMLIGEHIHNTYLYAFITSGLIGATAFTGGLIYAWFLFFTLLKKNIAVKHNQRTFFIQIGGVLAFFTVRSIPEVSGAMFGIDTMLILPAIAYLTVLNKAQNETETISKERRTIKVRW